MELLKRVSRISTISGRRSIYWPSESLRPPHIWIHCTSVPASPARESLILDNQPRNGPIICVTSHNFKISIPHASICINSQSNSHQCWKLPSVDKVFRSTPVTQYLMRGSVLPLLRSDTDSRTPPSQDRQRSIRICRTWISDQLNDERLHTTMSSSSTFPRESRVRGRRVENIKKQYSE